MWEVVWRIICTQGRIICTQGRIICTQGHIICTQRRIICTQGRIICTQRRIICTQGRIICTQRRIIFTQGRIVCTQGRIICTQSGTLVLAFCCCVVQVNLWTWIKAASRKQLRAYLLYGLCTRKWCELVAVAATGLLFWCSIKSWGQNVQTHCLGPVRLSSQMKQLYYE